jgi:hypothetical protein
MGPGVDSSRDRECGRTRVGRRLVGKGVDSKRGRVGPGADSRRGRVGPGADSRRGRVGPGADSLTVGAHASGANTG